MIDTILSLQKPLEDYIEAFEKQNARSLALLASLVEDGFIFQDPYRRGQGASGLAHIMMGRLKMYEGTRYKVYDFTWGRRDMTAYMFWSFSFQVKKKSLIKSEKLTHAIEGMSELVFSGDKKLLSHTDFWGGHEAFDVKAYKALDES